jgi:hypothetical protein
MKKMDKLFLFLIGRLCWLYIRFVALTSRIIRTGEQYPMELRRKEQPFIFGLWHNRQFFLCYAERHNRVHALVSQSKDGEFISRTVNLFGIDTIRGSTSKSGARALVRMIRTLRRGETVAVTPDGPRGPSGRVQPGIVHLAQKTGCPIVPISFSASRKKVFKSWDAYQVPYPFGRIAISYGEPFTLSPSESPEDAAKRVRAALDANTARGENMIVR